MKKVALVISVLLVVGAIALLVTQNKPRITSNVIVNPPPEQPTVTFNGQTYFVEIADTAVSQQHGLSERSSLPQDQGMLFIFADKQVRQFWMKDMHFPLDMIWIDGDTIVDISENVPPPGAGEEPVIVYPKAPVDKVLEVNAGEVEKYGLKSGQRVVIQGNLQF